MASRHDVASALNAVREQANAMVPGSGSDLAVSHDVIGGGYTLTYPGTIGVGIGATKGEAYYALIRIRDGMMLSRLVRGEAL